jgi:hypothetical protein
VARIESCSVLSGLKFFLWLQGKACKGGLLLYIHVTELEGHREKASTRLPTRVAEGLMVSRFSRRRDRGRCGMH